MKKIVMKLYHATRYSFAGIKNVYKLEYAFRIELYLGFAVIPLAILLGQTALQRALLISSWLLILIVELINSAIEVVVDRISLEQHELSGLAKDFGSAAVFIACVSAALIWAFISWDTFL